MLIGATSAISSIRKPVVKSFCNTAITSAICCIALPFSASGAIETDFGDGQLRNNTTINNHIAVQTALGRVGLPGDIGGAIAALVSSDSSRINGQHIEVSSVMIV